MTCVYCDQELESAAARPAFDPWLGRLWRVCPSCGRWNVIPLEDRWEALESLERAVRDTGTSLLRTPHLDLVHTPAGEVIRVGRAPRPELAGWRYGDALPSIVPRGLRAWLRRVLLGVPSAPHGYDTSEIGIINYPFESSRWFASPFIEDAPALTALFGQVPLSPSCPSCGEALALAPWSFQHLRLIATGQEAGVAATCVSCRTDVVVPLTHARPVLRLGLFLVNHRLRSTEVVEPAAMAIERSAGPEGLVRRMATGRQSLGEAGASARLSLQMALDEMTEAELLETEWREAEELAGILDGELTPSPPLDPLRRRVVPE